MNLEFWVCWASCQFCFSGLCRPNDSRMLVALGECYEKLNQLVEAKKVRGVRFTVEKQVGPYVTTQIKNSKGLNYNRCLRPLFQKLLDCVLLGVFS